MAGVGVCVRLRGRSAAAIPDAPCPAEPHAARQGPAAPLGAGEAAYFRSNRNRYAELAVWTATHYFTLQVSVPTGSTAEAIKPNTVALANAIIAKLR